MNEVKEVEDGGRSAGHAGPAGELAVALPLKTRVYTRVTASQTGGAYSLFELEVEPGGGEHPHIQHREDECLYILSGEFELFVEGQTLPAAESVTVYIRRGTLHGLENVGESPGRLLAIHTPGDPRERFLREAGRPVEAEPASAPRSTVAELARIRPLGARHGVEILACP